MDRRQNHFYFACRLEYINNKFVPLNFQIYLGRKKLLKHYLNFPDHQCIADKALASQPTIQNHCSNDEPLNGLQSFLFDELMKMVGQTAHTERIPRFLAELSNFTSKLRSLKSKLLYTNGASTEHFIDKYVSKLFDLPEGNMNIDDKAFDEHSHHDVADTVLFDRQNIVPGLDRHATILALDEQSANMVLNGQCTTVILDKQNATVISVNGQNGSTMALDNQNGSNIGPNSQNGSIGPNGLNGSIGLNKPNAIIGLNGQNSHIVLDNQNILDSTNTTMILNRPNTTTYNAFTVSQTSNDLTTAIGNLSDLDYGLNLFQPATYDQITDNALAADVMAKLDGGPPVSAPDTQMLDIPIDLFSFDNIK